jgi:hypothetical protein
MQLLLRLQENLAVNQLAITRNTERLPHAIANYYLSHRYTTSLLVETLKQQIQQAEERLDWFEPLLEPPLLEQITDIEAVLVQSRCFFTDARYYQLQKQWLWAVDQIGDLAQPQELVYRLATRLQWLLNDWSYLSTTYQQIEEIVSADPEEKYRNLLEDFQMYWETLWCNLSDLESLDADFEVRDAIQNLTQLERKVEVNV